MVDVHAWAARIERCARASLGDAAYLGARAAQTSPRAPRRAAPVRADVGTDLYGATIRGRAAEERARGRPPIGAEVRARSPLSRRHAAAAELFGGEPRRCARCGRRPTRRATRRATTCGSPPRSPSRAASRWPRCRGWRRAWRCEGKPPAGQGRTRANFHRARARTATTAPRSRPRLRRAAAPPRPRSAAREPKARRAGGGRIGIAAAGALGRGVGSRRGSM